MLVDVVAQRQYPGKISIHSSVWRMAARLEAPAADVCQAGEFVLEGWHHGIGAGNDVVAAEVEVLRYHLV